MTLPVFPNPISLNQVNVELGLAGTTLISLNQASVRTLAGVPSGAISMNNLHGKSNRVSVVYNITSNTGAYLLSVDSAPGYVAGLTDVIVNVSAGIYVAAPNTTTPALGLYGGSAGDTVTVNNSGYIIGAGGRGGDAGFAGQSANFGIVSGPSLAVTVNNAVGAYIAGGGGGGAGSASSGGGGGAGGGFGGDAGPAIGGAGGGIGASGTNGTYNFGYYGGGGGGRVLPGARTSASQLGLGGSSGGGGGGQVISPPLNGGYGGGPNEAGQTGSSAFAGGGGGWGAAGGSASGGPGGAGGYAIYRSSGATTVNNSGAIYGAVI